MSTGDLAKLIVGMAAFVAIAYALATSPARHRAWGDECRADGGRPVWVDGYYRGCAEGR